MSDKVKSTATLKAGIMEAIEEAVQRDRARMLAGLLEATDGVSDDTSDGFSEQECVEQDLVMLIMDCDVPKADEILALLKEANNDET